MFEGIKSFVRETRIRFDYPRYESEQAIAHQTEAERRFDVRQLQREVANISTQARVAGDQRFGNEISPIRKRLAALERDLQQNLDQLAIFERNYKAELDDLYAQKEVLFQTKANLLAESKRLRDERSQAHQ
jgi:phosphoglycerate-specific signal transduction histidine kinase